jgi:hypothetical protein
MGRLIVVNDDHNGKEICHSEVMFKLLNVYIEKSEKLFATKTLL